MRTNACMGGMGGTGDMDGMEGIDSMVNCNDNCQWAVDIQRQNQTKHEHQLKMIPINNK